MKLSFYLVALIFTIGQTMATDPWGPESAWTSHDGTIVWSGNLEKSYANCISEKNRFGEPVFVSEFRVKCKKNVSGSYLNAERDGLDVYIETTTIKKSDATEACKKIGGKLPTIDDFEALQNDPDYDLFSDRNHYFISSSLRTRNNYTLALGLNGSSGNNFVFHVDRLDSSKKVRCIKSLN